MNQAAGGRELLGGGGSRPLHGLGVSPERDESRWRVLSRGGTSSAVCILKGSLCVPCG